MSSDLPLSGIRVVDLADEKGELAGRLLADLGAEVIRVEPPEGGRSRSLPPFAEPLSALSEERATTASSTATHTQDDRKSLYFAYRNSNKLGLAIDLGAEDGRARLLRLLARADIFIEAERPGRLAELGLSPESLAERFPHLIVVSISDFGQTGPYRDWVATDATMNAMAGVQAKAGWGDREPLLPPSAMAYDIAGIMGAYAALAAYYQRERTGFGQTIDLSVLEAVAQQTDWSFSNATSIEAKGGDSTQHRMGSGPVYKIFPCRGGHVRLVMMSPRQWHAMREWLGDPDYLQDKKYDSFLGRMEIADAINVMIGDLFAEMDPEQVSREAQSRGIVCTPVLRPAEVVANEHFQSRNTFLEAEYAPGATGAIAAGFFELDGQRMGYRTRPPEINEHVGKIEGGLWPDRRPAPDGAIAGQRPKPSRPFNGLRVLDFGIGGVGVEAARFFADYGADVIKVESRTYPDFVRVIMSTEMSASFASSNRSKRAFGVNTKTEQGRELIHELVRQADVVIENNSTGTMEALGLGYETLRELNPRIVMASSQLLGSSGVWANWIGYGPSTQPIGGLVHLWDYADDPENRGPAGGTSIFPDHTAGRLVSLLAVATLIRRLRTGQGGHGETAQAEVVANIIGDQFLKNSVDPGSVSPQGNRSERGAPWGSYPCAGNDQWLTISIRDDSDWEKLRNALGNPDWADSPDFATSEGRQANHDDLDEKFSEWTRSQTRKNAVTVLQMFGVPAAPMYSAKDQMADPHFLARGYGRWLDQQGLGWMGFEGPAFRASGMRDIYFTQAPLVGEHTREIAQELLGLDAEEIEKHIASGILEVTEP